MNFESMCVMMTMRAEEEISFGEEKTQFVFCRFSSLYIEPLKHNMYIVRYIHRARRDTCIVRGSSQLFLSPSFVPPPYPIGRILLAF